MSVRGAPDHVGFSPAAEPLTFSQLHQAPVYPSGGLQGPVCTWSLPLTRGAVPSLFLLAWPSGDIWSPLLCWLFSRGRGGTRRNSSLQTVSEASKGVAIPFGNLPLWLCFHKYRDKCECLEADFLDESTLLIGGLQVVLRVQNFQSEYLGAFFPEKLDSIFCVCM